MIKKDEILFEGHLHWIIFLLPTFVFLLGCWLYQMGNLHLLGVPFMLIGIILGGYNLLNYFASSIQVTSHFLVIRTGILVRQTLNFSVQQLESVDIIQSVVGCLFNYGSLSVSGTGGTRGFFGPMANPLTCRRFLESMPKEKVPVS